MRPEANRDLDRIVETSSAEEIPLIQECANLLNACLRFDPQLQGVGSTVDPTYRRVSLGLLSVFFRLRPIEDRYVEIVGYARNPNWTP